jgi:hypothetical protein
MTGDLQFSVLRADDLLTLTFDCFNLELDRPQGQPPRLVRVTRDEPAFIVVVLPPQHVAEQFMTDSFFRPSTIMADPTRLAFQLVDDVDAIPFTLEGVLAWADHSLSVTANAVAELPGPERPGPAEPAPTQTSIELPYRLVLSPDASAGWAHAIQAVVRHDVAELWHTRLGVRQDGRVDETRMPTVRAVFARGLTEPHTIDSPLGDSERAEIAILSSDFTQTVMLLRGPGVPPGGVELPYEPLPLHATHLVLSALGGWTDLRGEWDFPNGDRVWPGSKVVSWRNVVAQGRDQYVRVVQRGFLFPLGHRAVLDRVIERKLAPRPHHSSDYLIQTSLRITVREPVLDYKQFRASHGNDAKLPLRRVRIETLVTPPLQDPPEGRASFVPRLRDGTLLEFHVVGEDWEGQRVDLRMPLAFEAAGDTGGGAAAYQQESLGAVALSGQQVALAPVSPNPGARGSTSLPVHQFDFAHQAVTGLTPPFLPFVKEATVGVPSIDRLVGSHAPNPLAKVELVPPDQTPGQVFAKLASPLDLNLPVERAGGMVRPNLGIESLSRTLGAMPPGLDRVLAGGRLEPAALFREALGEATLLGGIKLRELIGDIVDLAQLPGVTHTEGPNGVDVRFTWTPPLKPKGAGALRLEDGAALTLTTHLHLPVGTGAKPRLTVEGELTRFALDFAGVVRVGIDSLRFRAEDGKKLDVDPRGMRVELRNELSFLNALANILPADGFSDPPALRVTPDGVTADYSIGVPSAGIGIFSLENVAVSAGLVLPFVNRPAAFRLAFSDRAHPFLVSVSAIGGAGFFALEVDTGGIRRIEGSIEVGANLTVNLGIVSANVHVMAGFYFGLKKGPDGKDDIDFSAYLRIGGAVELLGIAGVSIEIYLTMTFEPEYRPSPDARPRPAIGGRAAVVVAVHLLMFTKSVSLTTERWFEVPALDPSFEELVDADDWETYCRAFA